MFDRGVSDPGPVAVVQRQVRAVRRRGNLHVVQHGLATWVAVAAAAATVVVLAALRGGRVAFALAAMGGIATASVMTVLLARRAARRWLPAADAPGRIDSARGLRGRVSSVLELAGRAQGSFFALLVRQNQDALPRWRPEDVVPEVVPARAFAAAVAALAVLVLVVVLAPALRAPAPRVVVGDRRLDFVAGEGTTEGAERILVAPGVDHSATAAAEGAAAEAADAEADGSDTLADLSASLQDWLQAALGAEERWEAGDERPPSIGQESTTGAGHQRTPAARAAADAGTVTGDGAQTDADGAASRRAGEAGAKADESGGGGGAGAGSETDPVLYGTPDDDPGTGADRFELAIAARVRTRRGAAMSPWTTAPGAEGDRRPLLAEQQRTEQPGHRMAVPASFAPLVRRLYSHSPGGGRP